MAMTASKDPVFGLAIRGLFFPFDERVAHKRMDRYRFLGRFCFARADEAVDDRARHIHCSCREVDVAPLQSEQLALPNAGRRRYEYQGSLASFQSF